jgi:hypothetical protein
MPDRLTLRTTLVLAAVVLGLAFAVGALAGGGASVAKPTAKRGPGLATSTPVPVADLTLTAAGTVPVLRAPPQRPKRRMRARKPAPIASRSVTTAPTPAPVASAEPVRPTPTAAPRQVAPVPPRVAPAPKPKPEPTPAATPETSGDFDTTGEP